VEFLFVFAIYPCPVRIVGAACDFGFVHDERLDGPYRLVAVDLTSRMGIFFDLGHGDAIGRISETVFAVGWNNSYVVAARHPATTNQRSSICI
jgi:hypothetical protein